MEQFTASDGVYACKLCDFTTIHRFSAVRHTQMLDSCASKRVSYVCHKCGTEFYKKHDYERHCRRKKSCTESPKPEVKAEPEVKVNWEMEALRDDRDKLIQAFYRNEFPAAPFRSWVREQCRKGLTDNRCFEMNKGLFYYLEHADGPDLGRLLGTILGCRDLVAVDYFLDIVQHFYSQDVEKGTKKSKQRMRKLEEMIAVLKGDRTYIQEVFV